jgi:ABC-type branched-subunit amino acid transport system ATPase component
MLQGGLAFDSLSVGENLALAGQHLPRSHRRARTDLVLAALPLLTGLLKRRAGLLSGGERHALAAAMTLLAAERPHVLLLDEPTAGLSSEAAGALLEGLRHLAQQAHTAVVLVEQNLEVALENADRAVLLRNGRAIESVSTTDTTLAEVTQRLLET